MVVVAMLVVAMVIVLMLMLVVVFGDDQGDHGGLVTKITVGEQEDEANLTFGGARDQVEVIAMSVDFNQAGITVVDAGVKAVGVPVDLNFFVGSIEEMGAEREVGAIDLEVRKASMPVAAVGIGDFVARRAVDDLDTGNDSVDFCFVTTASDGDCESEEKKDDKGDQTSGSVVHFSTPGKQGMMRQKA